MAQASCCSAPFHWRRISRPNQFDGRCSAACWRTRVVHPGVPPWRSQRIGSGCCGKADRRIGSYTRSEIVDGNPSKENVDETIDPIESHQRVASMSSDGTAAGTSTDLVITSLMRLRRVHALRPDDLHSIFMPRRRQRLMVPGQLRCGLSRTLRALCVGANGKRPIRSEDHRAC